MGIPVTCPSCSMKMILPGSYAGHQYDCRRCGVTFAIPPAPAAPPPAPATYQHVAPHPPLPQPQQTVNVGGQAVAFAIPQGRKANALGITSIVFGAIALLFCWIPFCGIVSWPVAVIGIVLGTIGLILALSDKQSGLGSPITGMALSFIALALSFVITGFFSSVIDEANKAAKPPAAGFAPPEPPPVPPPPAPPEPPEPPPAPPVKDGLEVKVTKAEVVPGYDVKARLFDSSPVHHDTPALVVRYEITNATGNVKYDSGGWPTGQLRDEHGNLYRLLTDDHVGRPDAIPGYLLPGETLSDVLVFEPPIPQKTLTLELRDGFSSVAGPPRPGSILVTIPAGDIIGAAPSP